MDVSFLTDFFGEYTVLLPMALLIIGALVVPALGLYKKSTAISVLAMVLTLASLIVNLVLLTGTTADGAAYTQTFAGMFEYNAFSGLMIFLFQIVLAIVVFVAQASIETTRLHFGAFMSLLLIAASGMMFVVCATDLIGIFVGVECVSISSYALVALKRNDPRAAEASVKYVIIGGLSTALTIYGISMIYGSLGTITLSELGPAFAVFGYSWGFVIGVIAMIAGYGFKIAAAPFHMWAPDVYEGASTPVSIFLATGSKKMGLAVFIKVFLVMFVAATALQSIEPFQYLFAIIAAVTMTVGNIAAISQTNIKRMLAYSSVAQAGYILILMAVMSEYAITGGIFHMFTHVFMKGGAFLVVGMLICAGVGEKITDYNGLAKRAPYVAFAMMIFLFSLAGVPPLAGFTSKFVLFSAAVYDPNGVMTQWVWLAFVAVLNSAISLYYYVRVIRAMYIEKPAKGCDGKLKFPATFAIAVAVCAVLVVVLGVYPNLLLDLCSDAAAAVFAGL